MTQVTQINPQNFLLAGECRNFFFYRRQPCHRTEENVVLRSDLFEPFYVVENQYSHAAII